MNSKINMTKSDDDNHLRCEVNKDNNTKKLVKMQESISKFCSNLLIDDNTFDVEENVDYLVSYCKDDCRILYSVFSNQIYLHYKEQGSDVASIRVSRMLVNIEKMIDYTSSLEFIEKKNAAVNKNDYECACKALIKIWDHINLAQQQYTVLKMSDEEQFEKIDARIAPFQKELSKELNSQLLTMISIFTALSFVLFGGISSLENLFTNTTMPTYKLILVGSVWGLCLLNLVFVFLICVSKMVGLPFDSKKEGSKIFQSYSIVWWINYILGCIVVLSLWANYMQRNDCYKSINDFCIKQPVISNFIVISLIISFGVILCMLTKNKDIHNKKD